jgi:hypothetical protein
MNNNEVRNENRQARKTANGKVKLICLECGKTKAVSPSAVDPRCACGSVDLDVL